MRSLGIRARLTIGTSILAALVLAIALLVARSEVALVLDDTAIRLARSDLTPFVVDVRTNRTEATDAVATGVLVAVRRPDGTDAVNTMPSDVRSVLPRVATATESFDVDDDDGRSYVVVGQRMQGADGAWSIWTARDVSASRAAISSIDVVFLASGAGLLAVMVVGSSLLIRRSLRPVEVLRHHAEHLSDGESLPVEPRDDELSRLARTLNGLVERVRGSVQRERRMIADAAHELRTPLAGLRAELELAARGPMEPSSRERLAAAQQSADRLAALATNLLELSRLEEGEERRITRSAREIAGDVLEAVDRARSRVAALAVDIGDSVDIAAPEARFALEPQEMTRVADNLLSNAIRSVGGSGCIRLDLREVGSELVLRVDDDGPGAPPEFLPHAFERFSRADDSRRESGSGLGLALVWATTTAAGGSATVQNLDPGFRVELRIPKM